MPNTIAEPVEQRASSVIRPLSWLLRELLLPVSVEILLGSELENVHLVGAEPGHGHGSRLGVDRCRVALRVRDHVAGDDPVSDAIRSAPEVLVAVGDDQPVGSLAGDDARGDALGEQPVDPLPLFRAGLVRGLEAPESGSR